MISLCKIWAKLWAPARRSFPDLYFMIPLPLHSSGHVTHLSQGNILHHMPVLKFE